MPRGLTRFYGGHDLHFITFSCYHRQSFLNTTASRDIFVETLEETRQRYEFQVAGYVVMPEHVHLLVSEPKVGILSTVLQVVKQRTTRKVNDVIKGQMWQRRFYDFNVFTQEKQTEKLFYMHENPVKHGLVLSAEDWKWSSARFYSFGEQGVVKILDEIIPTYSNSSYAKDGAPSFARGHKRLSTYFSTKDMHPHKHLKPDVFELSGERTVTYFIRSVLSLI
jgi:REP-associated tyrosine transposase